MTFTSATILDCLRPAVTPLLALATLFGAGAARADDPRDPIVLRVYSDYV